MKKLSSIAVIDDDPVNRMLLARTLEKQGYNVHEYDNGNHAMADFQKFRPNVVITDVSMPELDGLDITRTLRELYPDIKILVISQSGMNEGVNFLEEALSHGADHVLSKPIDLDILCRTIYELAPLDQ